MKKTPRALKGSRNASDVRINTPPSDETCSMTPSDFESSYLSICCLVQTESLASQKLVNESGILSRMFQRLMSGSPKDIEELTLGAISGSFSWVSSEIVQGLVEQGLLEYCHQVVSRHVSSRVPDRSCETAIDIIRDLVNLNEQLESWMLDKLEFYVNLVISCPAVFPSVTVKRSLARLVQTMVELHPRAFVSGLQESRLSPGSMQGLFSLCSCPDLETSCYMIISALTLEQVFGSQVIPASRSLTIDPFTAITAVVEESTTFTGEPTSEDQLRLDQWRSKLRGLGSLVEHVGDIIESLVADGIETTDSIEDKKFFTVRGSIPDIPLVDRLSGFEPVLGILEKLALSCKQDEALSIPATFLEDRDLMNVFGLVSDLIKIRKFKSFRLSASPSEISVAILAAKLLEALITTANVDLSVGGVLVQECLDVIQTLLLAQVGNKCRDRSINNSLEQFMTQILEKLLVESIGLIDNRQIVSDEEDEQTVSAIPVSCLQITQLVYLLGIGTCTCGVLSLKALGALTDTAVTPSVACWISETMFIVFGDTDNDVLLKESGDWIQRVSSLGVFLKTRSSTSSDINGTVENLKAFVQYKRSSWNL